MIEAVTAQVVRVSGAAWDPLLARLGLTDAYLRRDYVVAACVLEPGEPVLLHCAGPGGDIVFAFILRDIPGGAGDRDIVTPYGYGGPVGAGAEPPLAAFHAGFAEWCTSERVVSAFYRFHPLYANIDLAAPGIETSALAGTVAWRLDGGRDLMQAMHARHRRLVRKAQAAGVEVGARERPGSLATFVQLYEHTMQRQQAGSFYFFPERYWGELTASLRDVVVVFEAVLDGRAVASLLCFAARPWMHYHLGATADEARSIGASNLLFHAAAEWGQREGYGLFHLGGGVGGGDDGLLDFKRRFDPAHDLLPMHTGKHVLDRDRYRELAGTDDTSGYFPAYRRG